MFTLNKQLTFCQIYMDLLSTCLNSYQEDVEWTLETNLIFDYLQLLFCTNSYKLLIMYIAIKFLKNSFELYFRHLQ